MYEKFYNLTAEPFRLSPDHHFCYEHKGYAKARAYMGYAFMRAEGFVMITGRPGTGKTTLIGELIESLSDANVTTAHLVCTQLEADDLLKVASYAFGVDHSIVEKGELLQHLDIMLRRWHRDERRALLIVDEAQDLSESAMEELRLLTNIQEGGKPLLQIFLLGQPELRDLVLSPSLEQVHQRIIAASHLESLEQDETEAYIIHRLEKVGWRGDPALSRSIFPLVYKFSEGVPRRINLICSRMFLNGCVEQRHEIGVADVREVIKELQFEKLAAGTEYTDEEFELEDDFDYYVPSEDSEDAQAEESEAAVAEDVVSDEFAAPDPVAESEEMSSALAYSDTAEEFESPVDEFDVEAGEELDEEIDLEELEAEIEEEIEEELEAELEEALEYELEHELEQELEAELATELEVQEELRAQAQEQSRRDREAAAVAAARPVAEAHAGAATVPQQPPPAILTPHERIAAQAQARAPIAQPSTEPQAAPAPHAAAANDYLADYGSTLPPSSAMAAPAHGGAGSAAAVADKGDQGGSKRRDSTLLIVGLVLVISLLVGGLVHDLGFDSGRSWGDQARQWWQSVGSPESADLRAQPPLSQAGVQAGAVPEAQAVPGVDPALTPDLPLDVPTDIGVVEPAPEGSESEQLSTIER